MNIYALCAVSPGVDTLRLIVNQVPIAGVIGLSAREATPAISGYIDMPTVCQSLRLPFTAVDSYGLTERADIARLKALAIDVLIVCGWQRLVPEWLINYVRIGCIGAHGSPEGITGGRGRSPQNWALIAGADRFEVSIFFIEPGIDSGPVIATRSFPLTAHDDIVSSHLKVNLCVADMLTEAFRSGAMTSRRAEPQTSSAYYLPQRIPDDGAIDWRRSADEIARFVSALTRPYPGAFCNVRGGRLTIWRARPLAMPCPSKQPGRVVYRSISGSLVVETGAGLLLVDEHDLEHDRQAIEAGSLLEGVDFTEQMRAIIERHNNKYPGLPVASLAKQLAK